MNAIDESTSSARMTCGHTFHFGCMATWANTNPSCPLCRHSFGETEAIQRSEPESPFEYDENGFTRLRTIMQGVGGTGARTGIEPIIPLPSPNYLLDRVLNPRPTVQSRRLTAEEVFGYRREMMRPRIRRELEERYRRRPLEDVTYDGPDRLEIEMIMEHAEISRETAERYLAYHKGDVVETIMCFLTSSDDFPIPEFQPRDDRPALEESYVSRDIHNRTGTTSLTCTYYDDGYETA